MTTSTHCNDPSCISLLLPCKRNICIYTCFLGVKCRCRQSTACQSSAGVLLEGFPQPHCTILLLSPLPDNYEKCAQRVPMVLVNHGVSHRLPPQVLTTGSPVEMGRAGWNVGCMSSKSLPTFEALKRKQNRTAALISLAGTAQHAEMPFRVPPAVTQRARWKNTTAQFKKLREERRHAPN